INEKAEEDSDGDPSLDLSLSLGKIDPNPVAVNSTEPPPLDGHVVQHEEREYSCNYCPKKFSNKQALGGHQNAHKVEKVVAKSAMKGHESNYGYAGYQFCNGIPFPSSFNQAPERAINPFSMNAPYYPQYMQHQMHAPAYPMFPIFHEPQLLHTNPDFTSYLPYMGQGPSTSEGNLSADANNEQDEEQPPEELGPDLSLKL
ncbi:hypothetical protein MIMGU_mgv1a021296mg, partial [Erythranthe guttata]